MCSPRRIGSCSSGRPTSWPGSTALWVGSTRLSPLVPGIFPVTFENRLGLVTLRGENAAGLLGPPLHLEVIAAKFAQPEQSVAFLRQTLTDLFARVAAAPFALAATTERMVRESQAPPSALFAFHFFRHHGSELVHALQAVLGRPHRRLTADPELVRPHEVRQIEHESIIRALRASHPVPVDPAVRDAPMTPLQRLRPERIWQQLPIETHDTPENRFVLAVCRAMLAAIGSLRRAAWYQTNVDARTRVPIDHAAEQLAILTRDERFARLGPMIVAPAQSRVLQRRDGYRELAQLWQRFQRSRQPVFERMQQAIDLRNIAELYEIWVWFELIDRIQAITGVAPEHRPAPDDFGVPGWQGARFAVRGAPSFGYWSVPPTRHSDYVPSTRW